jgi:putative spermidine/putrescine transport system permease protein
MQLTIDQKSLTRQLANAERRNKIKAFLLVLPLLLFVLASFIVPIGSLVWQGGYSGTFANALPETSKLLAAWDAKLPVSEELVKSFVTELKASKLKDPATPTRVATVVNRELSGSVSKFKQVMNASDLAAPYKEKLTTLNSEWEKPDLWRAMKIVSPSFTPRFYLQAVDLRLTAEGDIKPEGDENAIHLLLFGRTLMVAALVTFFCALLGFPIAYLLAHTETKTSNMLLIIVLLPFWTSLLVRTTAWIALLQQNGVVNDFLVAIGLIDNDHRLVMMYNMFATLVAMTHVLLPFMILPMFSVMKTIKPNLVRAALSLGATPWTAFWKVYFPQTIPGLGAGFLLVFILAVGYYITPALVGGQSGQLISNIIAFHMQKTLNWSLASAIATLLLIGVLLLYWLYNRLVGIDKMKLA